MLKIKSANKKRSHSWPSAVYISLEYKTIANLDGDSVLVQVSYSCGGKFLI